MDEETIQSQQKIEARAFRNQNKYVAIISYKPYISLYIGTKHGIIQLQQSQRLTNNCFYQPCKDAKQSPPWCNFSSEHQDRQNPTKYFAQHSNHSASSPSYILI